MSNRERDFLGSESIPLKISEEVISFFNRKRIFFTNDHSSRLCDGEKLFFSSSSYLEPYCAILKGNNIPSIGSFSYSWSPLPTSLKVGRYSSIAHGLKIHGPRHPIEALTTSSVLYDHAFSIVDTALKDFSCQDPMKVDLKEQRAPIIENDVWIGANVTLSPGVRISTGAIVAAESVVTKNVPAYAIVGGNPTKFIRWRFSEEIRSLLEASQWWKYNIKDIINKNTGDPAMFLKEFMEQKEHLKEWRPRKVKASYLSRWECL